MSQADRHIYNTTPARSNGQASTANSTRSIYHAKVIEILEGHRLRVRIDGLDNRIKDSELPICDPLITLYFKALPEISEVVTIILSDVSQPYEERLWVGPVITQYQYFDGLPYLASVVSVNREGFYKQHEEENPRTRAESEGVFSNETDASEQVWNSRGSTDITQRKNQVRVRAGKSKKNKPLEKNNSNPATLAVNISDDNNISSITGIADKIYLLGHNGDPLVPATRNGEVTEALIKEMEETAHPATLTKHLVEFLDLFRQAFMLHAHGYDGMSLLKTATVKKLEEFNLDVLSSKCVRIN